MPRQSRTVTSGSLSRVAPTTCDIVTRFDIATYPQPEMLGGFISFNFTDNALKQQAKAISNYMDPRNFDPLALLEVNFAWFGGAWLLSDAIFYLEPNINPAPSRRSWRFPIGWKPASQSHR